MSLSALLNGHQIADDGACVTRVSSGLKHRICATQRGKPCRRKLGPEGRNALCFAQIRAKALFRIEVFPSPAALKLTDMGKPTLRERMPFRGNLVEANLALRNRH